MSLRLALAGAGGFLAGVLLVAILGGAKPARTVEVTVTERAATAPSGPPPTVITKTAVPDVVGERLDTALDRITRVGFDPDVDGGGVLGVVVESNWEVVAQDPRGGGMLEQGSTVRLEVERR